MKKLLSIIAAVLCMTTLSFGGVAFADGAVKFVPDSTPVNQIGGCEGAAASSSVCTSIKSTDNPLYGPSGILTKVGNIFALLTGIISVFMVIISGLRYVTSAGDPTKTATARKGIMYAAIGLVVSSAAGAIAQFILSKV